MAQVLAEIKEPNKVKKKKAQVLEERLLDTVPYEADEQSERNEEKEDE